MLVRGLQMARKIMGCVVNAWPRVQRCLLTTLPIYSADAFAGLIEGECVDESIPHAVESDEYLREYIRRTTITIYHPVRQVPCTLCQRGRPC